MKIREILSGTALGLINFIYFIFLLLTPLYLFYKNTIPMATPTSFILIYFIAALSLFLIYGILYTKKNIEELNHRTSKKTKNNFIILIEFVLYSLLIMFLSTLFLQIYFKRSNLVSLLLTLLIFSIISSLAIKKIITFFSHIISLQFFIQFYKKYGIRLTGYYKIFTYEEFIDKIQETFNHAKRFNTNMGLIFIYFYDLEKVFSDSEEKFIHKQIHFLFSQGSRNYEPWTKSSDKNVYIKLCEVNNQNNFNEAAERFYNIVKQNEFFIHNKATHINFKILNIYIDNNYLSSDKLDLFNDATSLLQKHLQYIKDMDEEIKFISLE